MDDFFSVISENDVQNHVIIFKMLKRYSADKATIKIVEPNYD